jgi:hypothetical protein
MDFNKIYGASIIDLALKIKDYLVISDLHLGYEQSLNAEGIMVPRFQYPLIVERLKEIQHKSSCSKIIVNGDLKHEFGRISRQEWNETMKFLDFLRDNFEEIILIKGNHDNYIENIVSRIQVPVVGQYKAAGITFVHGHLPSPERPLVMGHEHPSIKIVDRVGAYLKLPCHVWLRQERILVLPAYSPLASGTDLTGLSSRDYLSPILKGCDMRSAEIFACSDIGLLPLGQLSSLEGFRL